MAEARHTPRPWKVSSGGFWIQAETENVASLFQTDRFTGEEAMLPNAEANAPILAAALELLVAARSGVASLTAAHCFLNGRGIESKGLLPAIEKLESAIAKAEPAPPERTPSTDAGA